MNICICPHCQREIDPAIIARFFASRGGSTTGPTKARTRKQAQAAAKARWAKAKAKK